jgi:hypothetical protein
MDIALIRDDQNAVRTLGAMFHGTERLCETLELPWLGNKHDVSCIPEGAYEANLWCSPKHKRKLYWLQDVPGRGAIEIHIGNLVEDTHGCILLGLERDGDMIVHSRDAFDKFMARMGGNPFTLTITKEGV